MKKRKNCSKRITHQIIAKNRLRRGLEILEKYEDNVSCGVGHDVLYASEFNEAMTEEDILALDRLGWHLDEDTECWAKFM